MELHQHREAELRNLAEHSHDAAGAHGHEEHLTPHEQTRHEHEHDHAHHSFGHKEIEARAYELWEARGDGEGSADADWHQAVKELRERALAL